MALCAVGLAAAEDHVFDFRGIELRRFAQDILDAMRGQVFRARHIERAAEGFGERRCGNWRR